MQAAVDYNVSLGFGLMLQGPPKTGKTVLCGQFAHEPNGGVYFADCDNNLAGPLRFFKENMPNKMKHIFYDTINVSDTGTIIEDVARWERLIKCTNIAFNDPRIKTVVWDGLSSISDYLMAHIVNAKPDTKEKHMTISDWVPFRNMMSKAIVSMRAAGRSCGKLFIMTAHDEVNKNELDGSLLVTPNIPSKLAGNIGGFFSDLWHAESEEVDGKLIYKVRTQPRGSIPSLGNSLGLPKEMQFTWEGFAKYLYKYETTK